MGGPEADDNMAYPPHNACNAGREDRHIWSSPEWGQNIARGKQIFCNRSLNMKSIVAVGFDMDYTLAQYMPETFESLAYNGTIRKLVYNLGYPPELLEWSFDWKYMVRGLVVDKKRGNILKMDRHKYVKVAYHGFKEMAKEDKVANYGNTLIRDSFDEPDYALIDTLFSLAEAYLFAQLVDFKDNNPGKILGGADYSRMYKDVRAAVDLCHRDGTLKIMVAKDPKKYINEDLSIVPMLKMLRDSGRSTFLVTNSLWDYTNVVMNFLCGSRTQEDGSSCSYDWLENFDVVITGSSKPSFFHEDNRANLFEVEPETGMLLNTDNGTLLPQASWRTMLVVPELDKEVELLWETKDIRKELLLLRKKRDLVEDKIHHLNWSLRFEDMNATDRQNLSSELHELEAQREHVRSLHQQAQRDCHLKTQFVNCFEYGSNDPIRIKSFTE
ncbi:hypothetical protein QJS04_geneDACA003720 [Acorus gramineus]|uniref:Cytosolic purine 5'-nucleotidase n=1 Tax=Acorus gramineus TaxID=55184 RepID=A0AAV9BIX4_ACOGR|nr:hypothetical protein QJS04_geneDACA003720 [Acorus gramineus]